MANIVLAGFMGTGKSTVGRILSRSLGLEFHDLDDLIEKEAGMSVKEIFARYGEARFREMERSVIARLVKGDFGEGLVIAAGGGAIVNPANREALRKWGVVVCLRASVDAILRRVGNSDERPLIYGGDRRAEVERLLMEREAAYRDCDFEVDTTELDPTGVAGKIKGYLDSKGREDKG